jgi:hypothetical protein
MGKKGEKKILSDDGNPRFHEGIIQYNKDKTAVFNIPYDKDVENVVIVLTKVNKYKNQPKSLLSCPICN